MTNNVADFENTKCFLAIGTNTTEAHPVLAMKVRQSVANGAKMIVINPVEVDFVRESDLWLRNRSGSDVALLMGMMKIIYDEGLYDKAYVEERCENFDEFLEELKNYPLDRVSAISGVEPGLIKAAARMYATNTPSAIRTRWALRAQSRHR